jgi:hypothetical protein
MKKSLLVLVLALAMFGGAVAISVISSTHRSPSHWRALLLLSVV